MGRATRIGRYVDDNGLEWAMRVDGDYFNDPVRGWGPPADGSQHPFPRGWRPRCAIGLDATGRKILAIVPHLGAPLWTGESTTFTFEARDTSLQEATVIGLLGEKSQILNDPASD